MGRCVSAELHTLRKHQRQVRARPPPSLKRNRRVVAAPARRRCRWRTCSSTWTHPVVDEETAAHRQASTCTSSRSPRAANQLLPARIDRRLSPASLRLPPSVTSAVGSPPLLLPTSGSSSERLATPLLLLLLSPSVLLLSASFSSSFPPFSCELSGSSLLSELHHPTECFCRP